MIEHLEYKKNIDTARILVYKTLFLLFFKLKYCITNNYKIEIPIMLDFRL
jgi:hypothetical protein